MTDGSIDWSPWGEHRWRTLAAEHGASELQLMFAVHFSRCGNQTEAARLAGYSGNDDSLRQAGYRAANTKAVKALLHELAESADDNEPVDRQELKRIFSKVARSGSAPARVTAGKALLEIEQLERKEGGEQGGSPYQTLAAIRAMDPFLARWMTRRYSLPAPSYPDDDAIDELLGPVPLGTLGRPVAVAVDEVRAPDISPADFDDDGGEERDAADCPTGN